MTDSSKSPIKFIEKLLRKARRGEVVLSDLEITRSSLTEKRYKIEMKMFEPGQPKPPDPVEYVVLQARENYSFKILARPYWTLMDRVRSVLDAQDYMSYDTLRVPYNVHHDLMRSLGGYYVPNSLKLIVEPQGSGMPVFEDNPEDEGEDVDSFAGNGEDEGEVVEGWTSASTRRKMRQAALLAARRRFSDSLKTRSVEPAQPKTPAGASAAREIIFDD